jgi:hypothetical protein
MSEVKNYLQLPSMSPLPQRHYWVVNEDWTCCGYVIPRGFVSDLDTVPHIPGLFALIKGWARWSALLHDFLYSVTEMDRRVADALFYKCMLEEGVPYRYAKGMYLAVRAFGWRRFNKRRSIEYSARMQRYLADYSGDADVLNPNAS